MADIVLNDALGRIAEIFQDGGDFIALPMSATDADGTMKDGYGGGNPTFLDDFLGAAGNTEQTGSTWDRKTVPNASVTITIDDGANSVRVSVADQTWTAPLAGNNTTKLVICLDGASDAVREVLTVHDLAVTTDGNDGTADINPANGWWSSS